MVLIELKFHSTSSDRGGQLYWWAAACSDLPFCDEGRDADTFRHHLFNGKQQKSERSFIICGYVSWYTLCSMTWLLTTMKIDSVWFLWRFWLWRVKQKDTRICKAVWPQLSVEQMARNSVCFTLTEWWPAGKDSSGNARAASLNLSGSEPFYASVALKRSQMAQLHYTDLIHSPNTEY